MTAPCIQLLLTGNELMSGDVVDTNSTMIAKKLEEQGFSLQRKVVLGDDAGLLAKEIESISMMADVLVINGGLGPTVDDLTAEVLAGVVQQDLEENAIALSHLESWCARRNFRLDGPNRKQAVLPAGVAIVPNPVGSAVGFSIEHNNCLIICTPGVPSELEAMLDQTILPLLNERFTGLNKTSVLHLPVFGLGESTIQRMIGEGVDSWPSNVELGFRASLPLVDVKLTTQSSEAEKDRERCLVELRSLLGAHVVAEQETTLPKTVVDLLLQQGKTLATAESCTGGLIASQITAISGASAVFEMGIVSYSNRIKHDLLNVDNTLLEQHGAVSEAVVRAMALGALQQSKSDYAVAVSGVAGPDGGTESKPVGTVWVAWGMSGKIEAQCLYFPGPRGYFQQLVAAVGLDLVRRSLLGVKEAPLYFKQRKLP